MGRVHTWRWLFCLLIYNLDIISACVEGYSCWYFRINTKPPGVGQVCNSSHILGSYDPGLFCFPFCMENHKNNSVQCTESSVSSYYLVSSFPVNPLEALPLMTKYLLDLLPNLGQIQIFWFQIYLGFAPFFSLNKHRRCFSLSSHLLAALK